LSTYPYIPQKSANESKLVYFFIAPEELFAKHCPPHVDK
jgi:hypothetical protein